MYRYGRLLNQRLMFRARPKRTQARARRTLAHAAPRATPLAVGQAPHPPRQSPISIVFRTTTMNANGVQARKMTPRTNVLRIFLRSRSFGTVMPNRAHTYRPPRVGHCQWLSTATHIRQCVRCTGGAYVPLWAVTHECWLHVGFICFGEQVMAPGDETNEHGYQWDHAQRCGECIAVAGK
jgi:hypothetical protein